MDKIDMIIQQMDIMLQDQERMKERLFAIASIVDKHGAIISKIEEKIER